MEYRSSFDRRQVVSDPAANFENAEYDMQDNEVLHQEAYVGAAVNRQ